MKALSLLQPWATFVEIGLKNFETRSWQTSHRGELAIHASKKFDPSGMALYARVQAVLLPGLPLPPWPDLPRGCVLCVCLLRDIYPTEAALESGEVGGIERELGNYAAGRFAWLLTVKRRFEKPVPARGALSVWDWASGGEQSPGLSPCHGQASGSHPDQVETRSLRSLKPARSGRAPLRVLAVSSASATTR